MFNTLIIENFFDNFALLEPEFKKIPLYSLENFPETQPNNINWCGYRSERLEQTNPFLWQLVNKELKDKCDNQRLLSCRYNMVSALHLRLEDDESRDFVHTDPFDLTMIIYLSKTNLNSGTSIYDQNHQETQSVKFVQNTAILFDGRQNHRSSLNYGKDIDDGRLTLNCFINFL